MRLMDKEFNERLADFSRSTLELMATFMVCDRETLRKMDDITTDSELSEEQVVQKLLELKKKI